MYEFNKQIDKLIELEGKVSRFCIELRINIALQK